jgi:hypothetical protein
MKVWRIERQIQIEGAYHSGWLPQNATEPRQTPARSLQVWIAQESDGFYLFSAEGTTIFDSRHDEFEDAMMQANSQYDIAPDEWREAAAAPTTVPSL